MRTLTRHALFAAAFVSALGLAACGDSDRAALEAYFAQAQGMVEEMADATTRFETLMNVQGNILQWTAAEKEQLALIRETMDGVSEDIKALEAPGLLTDVHPILVTAVNEIQDVMEQVSGMADNPANVTEAAADSLMTKATSAETHMNEYLQKVEQKIGAQYPDMLPE